MPKTCPKCGSSMAPTYILVKEGKKVVHKIYSYICTKCSHVIPVQPSSLPS